MALLTEAEMKVLLEKFERTTILAKLAAEEQSDQATREKLQKDIDKVYQTLKAKIPEDAGGLDATSGWQSLPKTQRDSLQLEVRQAMKRFRGLSAPGPEETNHVMAKGYPSQRSVLGILGVCGVLTSLLLYFIYANWDDATYSCHLEKQNIADKRQTERNQRDEAARRRADAEEWKPAIAEFEKQLAPVQQRFLDLKSRVAVVNRYKLDARRHLGEARKAVADGAMTAAKSLDTALDLAQKGEQEANRLLGAASTAHDGVSSTGEQHGGPSSSSDADDLASRILALEKRLNSLSLQADSLLARVQDESLVVSRLRGHADAATSKRDLALADARRLEEEARQTKLDLEKLEAAVDSSKGCPPTEQAIMMMVMMIGASGGCLRLIASLVAYIGNRELKRSWVPYYYLMPLQSATLAAIVYLFVRAGAFSATVASADATDKLNLFNIYVYAGFAGMFAKDVTVKLRDLLSVFFQSKTRERNPLGGEKTPPA